MSSGADRAANLARAVSLCEQAVDAGARLIALPEMWEHIGPAAEKTFAGTTDGPQTAELRALAARRGVFLLAGSIAERAPDGRIFNTSVLLGPDGGVATWYRKIHLFDVDIPDGPRYRESQTVAPGGSPPPLGDVLGLRAMLSICYDVRFPELYRSLAADLLFVPAAFTAYTGRAHWEVLLRARAIENQAFVVAPAQAGRIGPPAENRVAYGHSCIIDPWGEVLAMAGAEGEAVVTARIDPARLAQVRRDLPALAHRRRDVLR